MKTQSKTVSAVFKKWLFLPMILLTTLISGCIGDRTTVVYGKVYDQDKLPVDSIMVLMIGSNLSISEVELKSTYTDENGEYEMLIEVPRKYHNVDVFVPHLPDQNPKFRKYKSSKGIGDSSKPMIGHKTQRDFELEPK